MAVYKNKSGQKLIALAWDTANNIPKTGDAANITALLFNDGGAVGTATNDVNPTELGTSGAYAFDATQAESNFDSLLLAPESSTADIQLDPILIYTQPETRDTGTALAVLSSPNPTGGTIDLSVRASTVGTTEASLSVPNPTGGTVDLSVRANTVGTAEAVISSPNPTGGTVDLVSSVTNLNFDGSQVNVNIEKINGERQNDGVDWDAFFKRSLSSLVGTVVRSGDTYTYLDQAGGTSMIMVIGTALRTVQ